MNTRRSIILSVICLFVCINIRFVVVGYVLENHFSENNEIVHIVLPHDTNDFSDELEDDNDSDKSQPQIGLESINDVPDTVISEDNQSGSGNIIDDNDYSEIRIESGSDNAKEQSENATNPDGVSCNNEDLYYFYSTLSADEKIIYDVLYDGMTKRLPSIEFPEKCSENFWGILHMVIYDHPELFWVDTNQFTLWTGSDHWRLECPYTLSEEEIIRRQEIIDGRIADFKNYASGISSEYEIVKSAYIYIIDLVDYQAGSEDNQNICSSLINNVSVCAGYSKGLQYILQQCGIKTIYAFGEGLNSDGWGPHAWNIVCIDGEYYNVDSTYGDGGTVKIPEILDCGYRDFSYLCVSDKVFRKDHQLDTSITFPECKSDSLNYYLLNGIYFEDYDINVKENMKRSVFNGEYYWTAEFANEDDYSLALSEIKSGLYRQYVFEYCQVGNIFFSYDDSHYTILCYYTIN